MNEHEAILELRGKKDGVSVLVLGGVHGNERTGIEVIQLMMQQLNNHQTGIEAGRLTLALGNLQAIEQNVRAIDGRDLNRYFSPERLERDDGSWEWQRANRIAELIREHDIVIDLHATNKPSVPFVASRFDAAHEAVYKWFKPTHILSDPQYIFGGGGPVATDEYADSIGKVGICFETGWVQDPLGTPNVMRSLTQYLASVEILPQMEATDMLNASASVFELHKAIMRGDEPFTFMPGRGEGSFEAIGEGDVIGQDGSHAVRSDVDGVILFPKLPEHQQPNKPVCYIAKRIDEASL